MQGKVEICGVNTAHLKTLKNDETGGAAAAQTRRGIRRRASA